MEFDLRFAKTYNSCTFPRVPTRSLPLLAPLFNSTFTLVVICLMLLYTIGRHLAHYAYMDPSSICTFRYYLPSQLISPLFPLCYPFFYFSSGTLTFPFWELEGSPPLFLHPFQFACAVRSSF